MALFLPQRNERLARTLNQTAGAIGSRYAPQVYGNHTEYKRHLKACQPILKRLLAQLKADKPTEFEQLQHRLTA